MKSELVVEGRKNGKIGLWHKQINSKIWKFKPTKSQMGANFTPSHLPIKTQGLSFLKNDPSLQLQIVDFKIHCSPTTLIVKLPNEDPLHLKIHLRGLFRLKGFKTLYGNKPMKMRGAIEFPKNINRSYKKILTKHFGYSNKVFKEVNALVSKKEIIINKGLPVPMVFKSDFSSAIK